jgi:hypothetical protein
MMKSQPDSSETAAMTSEGDKLRSRLAALRGQLRLVASWRGLAYLVTLMLAVGVLVGLIDYLYDLFPLVRAVALVGLLASAGLVLWQTLLRPLRQPMDDLSLALRIEERHPTLNDALASTVQFLDKQQGPQGESDSMRREAVRRTIARVSNLDFNKIVDRSGLRTATFGAIVFLTLALGFLVFTPTLAAKAFWRLATPFATVQWPKKTQIELEPYPTKVGRNREMSLAGIIHGVIPREGTLEMEFKDIPARRIPFTIKTDEDGISRFAVTLKSDDVIRPFGFRIYANDAVTELHKVDVLPLPQLTSFEGGPSPRLTLHYPHYTDLRSPHKLPPGIGNVDAVTGTVVEFRAAADRPLKRAWLTFLPEMRESLVSLMLAPLGSPDPLGTLSSIALSRPVYDEIPATLSEDRQQLHVLFRPALHGSYILHIEDDHELENSRQYELRIKPDPAPVVRLERPSPSRDALNVLPDAELPLELVIEDNLFAVREVWLEYRVGSDEPLQRRTLYTPESGLKAEMGAWLGGMARTLPPMRLRPQRLELGRILPLSQLKHADGSALKQGDILSLQAAADDFDNVSFKEPGRSHTVEIRIVSRETLRLAIDQEEARLQNQLAELRNKQKQALQKTTAMENRLRKNGKLSPEREAQQAENEAQRLLDEALTEEEKAGKTDDQDEKKAHQDKAAELRAKAQEKAKQANELKKQAAEFAEAMELQQQVREKVGKENEGLRAEIERLRETLKQNGLEKSSAMERANQVKRELERLAEQELDRVEPKLAEAKRAADLQDPAARQERANELENRAKQAENEARAALDQAKNLQEQAARTEDAAAQTDDPEEKARLQAEAKKSRGEALAQLEKAKEKQAAAQTARAEANRPADPNQIRDALTDARKSQEEVEKSLASLLADLEPSGSSNEIRREAGELLQKQREAMAELDEAEKQEQIPPGKTRDELNPEQQAALDAAAEEQRKLADRARQMATKMKRVAEERQSKDPEAAQAMKDAAEQVESGNIANNMKAAEEAIQQNKLNEARKKQQEALAELEKLNKNLEENREKELDRLAKKLREAEKKVEELIDEQEQLQKKIREAEKNPDEKERDEQLARLAKQQQKIKEKTEELLKDLSRLRNERAKQALGAAGEEMDEAGRQLNRGGKQDDEKQEDVLDRLEETRQELEKARRKTEEELAREQLARVADMIKRLRERQHGHSEEAKRIQDAVQQRNDWSRGLSASLRNLGENQTGLGEETDSIARKELAGAPVFSKLLQRAARSMNQAGLRAQEMRQMLPPVDQLPDAELARHQDDAQRRLVQLLESLKEAEGEERPLGNPPGQQGEDDDDAGGGGDDSLPPLAQLRLLRNLQEEINKRTSDFARRHPNLENLQPKAQAELDDIRREQKEVADLLEQMTRPPGEPEGKMEEKGDKDPEPKKEAAK